VPVEITPRFFRVTESSLPGRLVSRLDWSLVGAAVALAGLGVFFIFSATFHGGHSAAFLTRQISALGVGVLGMIALALLPYQVFHTYARGVYWVGIFLLLMTLVLGTRLRGSKSWINLHWFYFQPVELTRLILAIALAAYADAKWRDMKYWTGLIVPSLLAGIHFGLIMLQPDLSSALAIGPMTLAVFFAAGAPMGALMACVMTGVLAAGLPLASTYFSIVENQYAPGTLMAWVADAFQSAGPVLKMTGALACLMVFGYWFLRRWRVAVPAFALLASLVVLLTGVAGSFAVDRALKTYQRKRLIAFVDPAVDPLGAGYNILQSKITIGSGRLFGKGFLSGSQTQLGFLPEKHTDFIFSLIGEETGFMGAVLVLTLFFWIAWRAFDIAFSARDRFGRCLAASLGAYFLFSGTVNIGMVMGLMPVTGVPLPFLSYGGSGLVGSFLAVGLLLSIHLRRYLL
jgi:rod shape determining protein RodA